MNGLSFAAQLSAFRARTLRNHDRVRRGVALRLFKAIIMDTPVLTGRLRGNWQTSLNVPDRLTNGSADATGGEAINRAADKVRESDSNDILILTNSLPYVARIEYEGWSHTKAPAGMVRINVARFKNILGEELRTTSTRI